MNFRSAVLIVSFYAFQAAPLPWTEVEAIVMMREDETLTQVQQRAENEAARLAIIKANGLDIGAKTLVFNSQVVTDLVSAYSDGLLLAYKILDSRPEFQEAGGQRVMKWKTRLAAQVAPPRSVRRDPGFQAEIGLEKTTFTEGESVRFTVRVTRDAFIHVLNVGADQSVTVLLPNRFHPDNFIRGGTTLQFPSADEEGRGLRVRAALPENMPSSEERLTVIATRDNMDLVGKDFQEAVFKVFDGRSTGLITHLNQRLFKLGGTDWFQDIVSYRIVKRN